MKSCQVKQLNTTKIYHRLIAKQEGVKRVTVVKMTDIQKGQKALVAWTSYTFYILKKCKKKPNLEKKFKQDL